MSTISIYTSTYYTTINQQLGIGPDNQSSIINENEIFVLIIIGLVVLVTYLVSKRSNINYYMWDIKKTEKIE